MTHGSTALDWQHMARALGLARATAALASPNPQVGCVLTSPTGQVLGEGAHVYDQYDHAEIAALKQAAAAGHNPRGATAYVTLEPCAHHGRTGPCADALIHAGIARCVVATQDPNPFVSGQGIARLRAAGIPVTVGVCESAARRLNDPFALAITLARPAVTLKSAVSADGMLAPPPALRTGPAAPHWLTGPAARADVQRLRHASDAILTGIGTVLADDPALTDRSGLPRRRPLLRVVLDTHLGLPLGSRLATTIEDNLHFFCSPAAALTPQARTLTDRGARITPLATLTPQTVLAALAARSGPDRLLSILLEAGSALNAAFLHAGLVDRVVLYRAPTTLGLEAVPFAANGPAPAELASRLLYREETVLGPDTRIRGLLRDPWPASSLAKQPAAGEPSASAEPHL